MDSTGIGGVGGSSSPDAAITRQLEALKAEKQRLEDRIRLLEAQQLLTAKRDNEEKEEEGAEERATACDGSSCPLSNALGGLSREMVSRYSRHMLLPDFGVEGQLKLSNSSILVVGAGGLGSPIAMYLAACGVGCLGIVDGDIVELNNLHRQIMHTEAYIGQSKVKSAAAACHAINSSIKLVKHEQALQVANALDIIRKYDIVVDATDNLPTRYLINDCCCLLDKPLVSGAALGFEGQLTVYHYNGAPCYRCLFPTPPPTAACQRCSDSGVLGVVPGVIGCLQALEAIKVATAVGEPLIGRMLLFDALSSRIRIVKIRGRSLSCSACGDNPMLNQESFQNFDYENFTQSPMSDKARFDVNIIPEASRISSQQYSEISNKGQPHVLLDVRPAHHFKIAAIPESMNIPLSELEDKISIVCTALGQAGRDSGEQAALYVICRRGNDSQMAVQYLNRNGFPSAKDVIGGLESWAQNVDSTFPIY